MKLIAITTALVAAGCVPAGAAANDADGGGATPTTGLYDLTRTTTGNCQPPGTNATLQAFVIADDKPGEVRVTMPTQEFASAPFTSWQQTALMNGAFAIDVSTCGASQQIIMTIEDAAADHVRVRRVDTFSNVAAANPSLCVPGSLPASDCTLTTELDYELTRACPDVCIKKDAANGAGALNPTFHCSC